MFRICGRQPVSASSVILLSRPSKTNEEAYRRHTKGNSLYRNAGDGTFQDQGAQQRVEMGRWAWASGGFDLNLDGAPEIFVATGMTTNAGNATDLNSFFWRQVVAKTPSTQAAAPGYEDGWSALTSSSERTAPGQAINRMSFTCAGRAGIRTRRESVDLISLTTLVPLQSQTSMAMATPI